MQNVNVLEAWIERMQEYISLYSKQLNCEKNTIQIKQALRQGLWLWSYSAKKACVKMCSVVFSGVQRCQLVYSGGVWWCTVFYSVVH